MFTFHVAPSAGRELAGRLRSAGRRSGAEGLWALLRPTQGSVLFGLLRFFMPRLTGCSDSRHLRVNRTCICIFQREYVELANL